jgi:hypothetical protein
MILVVDNRRHMPISILHSDLFGPITGLTISGQLHVILFEGTTHYCTCSIYSSIVSINSLFCKNKSYSILVNMPNLKIILTEHPRCGMYHGRGSSRQCLSFLKSCRPIAPPALPLVPSLFFVATPDQVSTL